MGYAVILLALHPEWQDWVREELQVLDEDPSAWAYEDVFPRCRRTLALMVIQKQKLFTPTMKANLPIPARNYAPISTGPAFHSCRPRTMSTR